MKGNIPNFRSIEVCMLRLWIDQYSCGRNQFVSITLHPSSTSITQSSFDRHLTFFVSIPNPRILYQSANRSIWDQHFLRYEANNQQSIRRKDFGFDMKQHTSIDTKQHMSIDTKGTTLDRYERSSLTKGSGQQAWNMDLHEVLALRHRCEVDWYENIDMHASANLQI